MEAGSKRCFRSSGVGVQVPALLARWDKKSERLQCACRKRFAQEMVQCPPDIQVVVGPQTAPLGRPAAEFDHCHGNANEVSG